MISDLGHSNAILAFFLAPIAIFIVVTIVGLWITRKRNNTAIGER